MRAIINGWHTGVIVEAHHEGKDVFRIYRTSGSKGPTTPELLAEWDDVAGQHAPRRAAPDADLVTEAARHVVECWARGDLAAAVRRLAAVLDEGNRT
jgi:hypothetical protein